MGQVVPYSAAHTIQRWRCWPAALLTAMAALLFYSRLGCQLLEPEEARYAEIPRQMLVEGRFATPVLHGEDYYQKPPLLYWLVMACYQVFGVHDWAARLVPSTSGALVVLLTYWWGRRTMGPAEGFAGGVIACLSARFVYLGGMLGMDSLLCLWVVAALGCAHVALQENRRSFWILSALACGMGIMTKGPVAAVLVVTPTLAWTWWRRSAQQEAGLSCPPVHGGLESSPSASAWLLYIAVALLPAAPWYIAVAFSDPEAAGAFFWLHNLVRYVAPFDHEKPAWFYLPSMAVGMLPWSLLLIPVVRQIARRGFGSTGQAGYCLLAFGWGLLFFSLSGCKRAGYILPAFPPLALALGAYVVQAYPELSMRRCAWCVAGMFGILWVGSMALLPDYHRRFGLRGQVRQHGDLSSSQPVLCYPRRWDSISFYLQRNSDVLVIDGQREPRPGLVFVKRAGALTELLEALPPGWEFVPQGGQGAKVAVGLLRRCQDPLARD